MKYKIILILDVGCDDLHLNVHSKRKPRFDYHSQWVLSNLNQTNWVLARDLHSYALQPGGTFLLSPHHYLIPLKESIACSIYQPVFFMLVLKLYMYKNTSISSWFKLKYQLFQSRSIFSSKKKKKNYTGVISTILEKISAKLINKILRINFNYKIDCNLRLQSYLIK